MTPTNSHQKKLPLLFPLLRQALLLPTPLIFLPMNHSPHSPPFHPPPLSISTLLLPAPPPRQKAQRKRSAKGREREPDERGIGLCLPAPVCEVDRGADGARFVDAGIDDDVAFGVGGGGAGVGA